MTKYTAENVQDWDFRDYRSALDPDRWEVPNIASMDTFLMTNFMYVMVVDQQRLSILSQMVEDGHAELVDGYVVPSELGGESLRYMTSFRDRLTESGRLWRAVVKSLVLEWERNRRLRLTVLPPPNRMREIFPGLYED